MGPGKVGSFTSVTLRVPEQMGTQLKRAESRMQTGELGTLLFHKGPLRIGSDDHKRIGNGLYHQEINPGETVEHEGERKIRRSRDGFRTAGYIAMAVVSTAAVAAILAVWYYNSRLLPEPGEAGMYGMGMI